MVFGDFKAMWLMCMFDLPTETGFDKREYIRFRKVLLKNGFNMIQYSVYVRSCPSYENLETHRKRLEKNLPSKGEIRFIPFTDHQFGKMKVYYRSKRIKTEESPNELTLF